MKIAIVAAMEEEVQILREKIIGRRVENQFGMNFYLGQLAGHDVVLLKSGIGKVAAATSTTLLLSRYKIDAVINTGSAGGLNSSLNIGDILVSTDVTYHDANVTAFGYQQGQMPDCPVTFPASKDYQKLAMKSIAEHKIKGISGLICSGDTFVKGDKQLHYIQKNFPKAIAVEMEGAAIGHVCWLLGVPFIVVRAVSDVADKKSDISFEKFLSTAAKHSSLIVETMLHRLTSQ